ncbi:hypothetical protein H8959_020622 [Pygathrix nigripes]
MALDRISPYPGFLSPDSEEARSDKSPDLAPTPAPQSTPRNTISQSISGDPEIDKKIKNLKKKLKAIEQLKEQAATGKQLEKNQQNIFDPCLPFYVL